MDSGIAMPSALATFAFTVSEYWVGCSIGSSPALAPLKILSTYSAARRHVTIRLGRMTSCRQLLRSPEFHTAAGVRVVVDLPAMGPRNRVDESLDHLGSEQRLALLRRSARRAESEERGYSLHSLGA